MRFWKGITHFDLLRATRIGIGSNESLDFWRYTFRRAPSLDPRVYRNDADPFLVYLAPVWRRLRPAHSGFALVNWLSRFCHPSAPLCSGTAVWQPGFCCLDMGSFSAAVVASSFAVMWRVSKFDFDPLLCTHSRKPRTPRTMPSQVETLCARTLSEPFSEVESKPE
jgi:hypothetical protein